MPEEDELVTLPPLGIFAEINDDIRQRLARAGRLQQVKKGTWLSVQGEPHDNLAFIISGKVSVSIHAHGDTIRLADLGPGNTVGEMNMIDPHVASANTRVIEDAADLWLLDRGEFDAIQKTDPEAGLAFMKALAKGLCRHLRRDSESMLRTADEHRSKFLDMDY